MEMHNTVISFAAASRAQGVDSPLTVRQRSRREFSGNRGRAQGGCNQENSGEESSRSESDRGYGSAGASVRAGGRACGR